MEQNKNSSSMFDQRTIIAIIVLILISSQLWTIAWDIGKAALYIVILLLILSEISFILLVIYPETLFPEPSLTELSIILL